MGLELDVVVRVPWQAKGFDQDRLQTAMTGAVAQSRVTIVPPDSLLARHFDNSLFPPPDVIVTLGKPVGSALKEYARRFYVPRIGLEATPNGDVEKSYVVLPGDMVPPEGRGLFFAGSFYAVDTHQQIFGRLFQSISREKVQQLGDMNREMFAIAAPFGRAVADISPDGLNASYHNLLDEQHTLENRLKSIRAVLDMYKDKEALYGFGWDERMKLLGQTPNQE
jgi:hypothetical protein